MLYLIIILHAAFMLRKNMLFCTTPAFVMGILLLNLRPMVDKLFATHHFSAPTIVLIGTIDLITWIPECIVLAISYAIQYQSSRENSNNPDQVFHYLFGGILIMLCMIVPILSILSFYPVFFLRLVTKNTPITSTTLTFFQLRLFSCFLQCCIFCFRGFYAAHRNNRLFFSVIATSLLTHTLLTNLLLNGTVWLAPLGIQGLGLSHCFSTLLGLSIYLEQFSNNIEFRQINLPPSTIYFSLLRMSIPLSIHGLVDHIGTTLIFFCTEYFFGLVPLASLHLISSIQGIYPGAGFGLTALTEVTKAHATSPKKGQQTGRSILLAGISILGSIGIFTSILAPKILQIAIPHNPALQATTIWPLQIMLASLGIHVGCQIMLKTLQAIDQTIASVSINLLFVYGFRTPLLLMLSYFSSTSLATVLLILTSEKLFKFSVMLLYWHKSSQTPNTSFVSTYTT